MVLLCRTSHYGLGLRWIVCYVGLGDVGLGDLRGKGSEARLRVVVNVDLVRVKF